MPNTFATTSDGILLVADGLSPVLAWDGFSAAARKAGVPKPLVAPTLAFANVGKIVGTYRAFLRFVDARGNPSNLSPVSAEITVQTATGTVAAATATSPIVLTTGAAHGLINGARVTVADVGGQTGANGTWDITVVSPTKFSLDDSFSSGTYNGGGTWAAGAAKVRYTNVQLPPDERVKRRQILRNTDGQQRTFYVDVDTPDLTATAFDSPFTDDQLAAQLAVPLLDAQERDIANVHGEPPDDKPFVLHHVGRTFLAGAVTYTEGAVKVTFGSKAVEGLGTEWLPAMAGRFLYVVGGDKRYEILSCDPPSQTLTLTEPYAGPTRAYTLYAIIPSGTGERVVLYSDVSHSEGFSPLLAFTLPDDEDEVTGLLAYGSFLYVLEHRNIYRFTYSVDPEKDGALFQQADRGCINERCAVSTPKGLYMLDEQGVHIFDSKDDQDVSDPIQTLFRPEATGLKINFGASRFFHAVYDLGTQTIRWFVALSGSYLPRHALCYHYTVNRWDIEAYPFAVGCSAVGRLYRTAPLDTWGGGRPQVYLGATGRRVLAPGTSTLDGVGVDKPNQGGVLAAGRISLTGPIGQAFPPECVGAPVAVVSGRGEGQVRIITAVAGNVMKLKTPWTVVPDATSYFQIGGIPWRFATGWFRWAEEEQTNPRAIEVACEPATTPASIVLNVYADRSDVPLKVAVGRKDQDGVTTAAQDGDIRLLLHRLPGGIAQLRMESGKLLYARGQRTVSVGLHGVGGATRCRVYGIVIDGASALAPSHQQQEG